MGIGIWTVLCIVLIVGVVLSGSINIKILFAIPVVVVIALFFSFARKWGKGKYKADVNKAQGSLMHLLHKDEKLFRRLAIESRKKSLNEKTFHEYMQKELAELDSAISQKFDTLAHKKLAICSTLIQIFENIDENWQTHSLKDHHMGWSKAKPDKEPDNKHGATRREQVEQAFGALEYLSSLEILKKYLKVLDVQVGSIAELIRDESTKESLKIVGSDLQKSPDEIRADFHKAQQLTESEKKMVEGLVKLHKEQADLLAEANHSYVRFHKTNHILTSPLHDAHVLGVRNTLKGFYAKAVDELKITHELFLNEDIKRKLLANAKKVQ